MSKNYFELDRLLTHQTELNQPYLEFLRHSSLSLGIYSLEQNAEDKQQPHTEDEVYLVVSGKAMLKIEAEEIEAKAGSILFVPAHARHYFHTIEEKLVTLVFFAPAEYSLKEG